MSNTIFEQKSLELETEVICD